MLESEGVCRQMDGQMGDQKGWLGEWMDRHSHFGYILPPHSVHCQVLQTSLELYLTHFTSQEILPLPLEHARLGLDASLSPNALF